MIFENSIIDLYLILYDNEKFNFYRLILNSNDDGD